MLSRRIKIHITSNTQLNVWHLQSIGTVMVEPLHSCLKLSGMKISSLSWSKLLELNLFRLIKICLFCMSSVHLRPEWQCRYFISFEQLNPVTNRGNTFLPRSSANGYKENLYVQAAHRETIYVTILTVTSQSQE